MIVIAVNGKERQLDEPVDLKAYVESLGVNMNTVAVAHNGEVVKKDELGSVVLADGDRIEVVRAVGGG